MFFGLKFSIPGIFGVGKFSSILGRGGLKLSRVFGGYTTLAEDSW